MALVLEIPATIYNGQVTVTAAGTRVMLAQNTLVKSVTIKASGTNVGRIYVGNSTVSSANGFQLSPLDSVSFDISNLNIIFIDAENSGSSVSYLAIT